ncbi:multidrug effflux MFS transporter [Limobrevibacterium gyesilva]|uniref:Bcr/CflA family efflux transporter n=1 Tax=Limobrevibacterium gyesilva TaxID=2991712 RepID=A0AA41YR53_9PROT|nr:multidrug effflux MFS transporter [Limobrevibacterium gyesilva]MCW3477052.1 multidrug effflux MFS transporter [Limobrevibacterium gyesilva]
MRIRPDSFAFTVLIGALVGLPPLSIDMGLPALSQLQPALGATPTQAALTLSFFMAGFALAQIVLGPLSDRIGRRPVLLWAMALYTLAGAACAAAASIEMLLACRFAQGAGAAGGVVLAFAIVRDLFEGNAARIRLSTISMVFSLAPVIAPTLGGWMLALGGWRAIYATLTMTGLILTLAVAMGLPESRSAAPCAPYTAVLRQRRTVGYGVVGALNLGSIFAFVAASPLVLLDTMHLSTAQFGLVFGVITAGIIAGAWVNGWLVKRGVSPGLPLGGGLVLSAVAAIAGTVLAALGHLDLLVLVPLLVASTFCRGLVSPNITHLALERVPDMAGAASALTGSLQMFSGALSGLIVGLMFAAFGPGGMCATMAAFAVPSVAAWLVIRRR